MSPPRTRHRKSISGQPKTTHQGPGLGVLTGLDKRLEQWSELASPPEVLGMPLHANAEAGGRTLGRFDDTVGGGCGDLEALRHMLDRLMVTAVDGTGVALVEGLLQDVPETRSFRDPDVVCDRVPGLADAMIERPGDLRRDVLNERAPARPR